MDKPVSCSNLHRNEYSKVSEIHVLYIPVDYKSMKICNKYLFCDFKCSVLNVVLEKNSSMTKRKKKKLK